MVWPRRPSSRMEVLHRPIFMKYLAEFPREMVQFQEARRQDFGPGAAFSSEIRKRIAWYRCDMSAA